ncbi:hypothetical protein JHK87_032043 [Glycine soja]|nr:hypothetical protein JHK87_032043 [Glycine soja]
MARKLTKAQKKIAYDAKLCKLLDNYTQILVVAADNVGSNQLQNIRHGLRGDSVILMGKNTMMKRSIKIHAQNTGDTTILNLIPLLVGNVGLIFTKGDVKEVKEVVSKYKVAAPARVGLVAPIDVIVPPGNTGLDPSQTSFFQVLNIPTKINKGTVEIVTPVELIMKGDKGVCMVSSLSLAISYPSIAAAPHMFVNSYKNILAVAVATEYSFPEADKVKEYLKDPSKFAVAVVAAPATKSGAAPAAASKVEEKKEEADESDDDMGFSLFD